MINQLKALAALQGDKLEIASIDRIAALREGLERFKRETKLTESQLWALSFSDFNGIPKTARSIIVMAVPANVNANITFHRDGREVRISRTLSKTKGNSREFIASALGQAGHTCKVVTRLPLKRLAVQSGLAEYGRNNIAYVEGIGSFMTLAAFASDMPFGKDAWREPVVASACRQCDICLDMCPSGAIHNRRFLINVEKCKKCSTCRINCPLNMNLDVLDIVFDEAETEIALGGAPYADISAELEIKMKLLGLDGEKPMPPDLRAVSG